jgi:hypothetical protein
MVLVVVDLHGRGINVWFEGLEGVQKIRDFVGVGSDWDTGSSDNSNTLGKEGTTGVSTGGVYIGVLDRGECGEITVFRKYKTQRIFDTAISKKMNSHGLLIIE